jgi:BlaI family transcriptional regulator, penicillinase repressor
MTKERELSRRERQIMDVLHARSKATAKEVQEALKDPPSYSAVRALLRILEDKGHIKHRQEGNRYIYLPRGSREKASQSALRRVVSTFFGGSARLTIAALLDEADAELGPEEIERLKTLISDAKKEGR